MCNLFLNDGAGSQFLVFVLGRGFALVLVTFSLCLVVWEGFGEWFCFLKLA